MARKNTVIDKVGRQKRKLANKELRGMRKGRLRCGSLWRSIKYAISITELTSKVSREAANAKLSKAPPPPLTWYQLKKKAKKDVIDMMMPMATTGELNLECILPTKLGSMFRSARALIE